MKGHDAALNGNPGDSVARTHGHRSIPSGVQRSRGGVAGMAQTQSEASMIHLVKSAVATGGAAICAGAFVHAHTISKFILTLLH